MPTKPNYVGATIGMVLLAIVIAVLGGVAAQQPPPKPTPTPTPPPVNIVITPINKMCVVNSKSPLNPAVKPGFYKGHIWGFCCESCRWEFERKPGKFVSRYILGKIQEMPPDVRIEVKATPKPKPKGPIRRLIHGIDKKLNPD